VEVMSSNCSILALRLPNGSGRKSSLHPPNKALQLTRRHLGRLSVFPRYRLYFV
jgi:hypothetical protein